MEAAKYRDKLDDYWAKREKEEVSIQDFFKFETNYSFLGYFGYRMMFDVGFQARFPCSPKADCFLE